MFTKYKCGINWLNWYLVSVNDNYYLVYIEYLAKNFEMYNVFHWIIN